MPVQYDFFVCLFILNVLHFQPSAADWFSKRTSSGICDMFVVSFSLFWGKTRWKLQMLVVLSRVNHPFRGLWDTSNADMLS